MRGSTSRFSASDRLVQFERGADGTDGVVLVRDGVAEHGHHRIADVLLDHPAVTSIAARIASK